MTLALPRPRTGMRRYRDPRLGSASVMRPATLQPSPAAPQARRVWRDARNSRRSMRAFCLRSERTPLMRSPGYRSRVLQCPHPPQQFVAVRVRHADIAHQHVRRVLLDLHQRFVRGGRAADLRVTFLENAANEFARVGLVVDDQHLQAVQVDRLEILRFRASRCPNESAPPTLAARCPVTGRRIVKVVPLLRPRLLAR